MISAMVRDLDGVRRQRSIVALLVASIAFLTITTAWVFQWIGYAPCEICLTERIPYYVGIPLALSAVALQGRSKWRTAAYLALIITFSLSSIIGFYHAGLEWHFWLGPTTCAISFRDAVSAANMIRRLSEAKVVQCDVVAIRVFCLSLAVWNVVVSLTLTGLPCVGLLRGAAATRMSSSSLFGIAK